MISRTIEAVEIAGKTMFYEICVEDIEFHILGQTVKTNKWLRFEEWQQIYEQISKSFATYSTPPDFTIKSFTVGNYIRVEMEQFPIKICYGDLFKMKLENCLQDFLQIRIKQIALGSSLEEIQQAERKQEEIAAAIAKRNKRDLRKSKKKRRKNSISEYNPVTVKRNVKGKSVPLYKPSKLSPEAKEFDEPYSPKPMNTGDDSADDYTPYVISSSDKDNGTPTIVPPYKPSAIIKKSSEDRFEPGVKNEKDRNDVNSVPTKTCPATECTDRQSATPSPIFDSREKSDDIEKDDKERYAARTYGGKPSKLSQDLFADSEGEYSKGQEAPTNDNNCKLSGKSAKRKRCDKDLEVESEQKTSHSSVAKTDENLSEKCTPNAVGERRSARKAKKLIENINAYSSNSPEDKKIYDPTQEELESNKRARREKKDVKNKKLRPLIRQCHTGQESVSSKGEERYGQTHPMPTMEELEENNIRYEREIEMLENFSKDLKEKLKPPPSIETIDLNAMKVKDLIATFKDFKPKLDNLFEKYKKQKRFQCSPESEKLHLLILNIIDRSRVLSLMDHLQSIYEPDCDAVPTYTDLFMNMMAPEWVLRIFMKKYSLSREEAIERIKLQRDAEAFNQSQICTK